MPAGRGALIPDEKDASQGLRASAEPHPKESVPSDRQTDGRAERQQADSAADRQADSHGVPRRRHSFAPPGGGTRRDPGPEVRNADHCRLPVDGRRAHGVPPRCGVAVPQCRLDSPHDAARLHANKLIRCGSADRIQGDSGPLPHRQRFRRPPRRSCWAVLEVLEVSWTARAGRGGLSGRANWRGGPPSGCHIVLGRLAGVGQDASSAPQARRPAREVPKAVR